MAPSQTALDSPSICMNSHYAHQKYNALQESDVAANPAGLRKLSRSEGKEVHGQIQSQMLRLFLHLNSHNCANVRPVTHASETGSRNRRNKFDARFRRHVFVQTRDLTSLTAIVDFRPVAPIFGACFWNVSVKCGIPASTSNV